MLMSLTGDGSITIVLDAGKEKYELATSSETKYVGVKRYPGGYLWDSDDVYEVYGHVNKGSRFGIAGNTIEVKRIRHLGKANRKTKLRNRQSKFRLASEDTKVESASKGELLCQGT